MFVVSFGNNTQEAEAKGSQSLRLGWTTQQDSVKGREWERGTKGREIERKEMMRGKKV